MSFWPGFSYSLLGVLVIEMEHFCKYPERDFDFELNLLYGDLERALEENNRLRKKLDAEVLKCAERIEKVLAHAEVAEKRAEEAERALGECLDANGWCALELAKTKDALAALEHVMEQMRETIDKSSDPAPQHRDGGWMTEADALQRVGELSPSTPAPRSPKSRPKARRLL